MNDKNDKDRHDVPFVRADELQTDHDPGDIVAIATPCGTARLIWLSTVSNGRELGAAMRAMVEIAKEKEGEPCPPMTSGFLLT